jgi:hypothetical protein
MRKRRWLVVSGAVVAALLLVSAVGVTVAFAQEPEPEAEAPLRERLGPLMGGRRGGFGGMAGKRVGGREDLAEALGLTAEELRAELRDGKTLEEIADAQGVDLEALRAEWEAEREQSLRDAIAQKVADGEMSEEQAEWLLEGLDEGFLKGLRGLIGGPGRGVRGHGFGRCPEGAAADEAETSGTST